MECGRVVFRLVSSNTKQSQDWLGVAGTMDGSERNGVKRMICCVVICACNLVKPFTLDH